MSADARKTLRARGLDLGKIDGKLVRESLAVARVQLPPRATLAACALLLLDYLDEWLPPSHATTCETCGAIVDARRECPFCTTALVVRLNASDLWTTTARGEPRANVANVIATLVHVREWQGVIAYDEMRQCVALRKPAPWHKDDAPSERRSEWSDEDAIRLASYCSRVGLHVATNVAREAASVVAQRNSYHPVREWLASLTWDGAPRLDEWLVRYCGAEDNATTRAIGAKFLISAVARATRPGCKVDHVLVLEGAQGAGKSTVAKALAMRDEWYLETSLEIGAKDSYQVLRGKWIVELAELESLTRAEVARVRAFISSQSDSYRASYGRDSKDYPRHCVFLATTNDSEYLKDATGARRFWPVRVADKIDVAALRGVRDQLWAEARVRFEAGEAWHVEDAAIVASLRDAQEERYALDPWEVAARAWLVGLTFAGEDRNHAKEGVTTASMLRDCMSIDIGKQTRGDEMRAATVLRRLGWEPRRMRKGGERVRLYFPREDGPGVGPGVGPDGEAENKPLSQPSQPTQPISRVSREDQKAAAPNEVQKPGGPVGTLGQVGTPRRRSELRIIPGGAS